MTTTDAVSTSVSASPAVSPAAAPVLPPDDPRTVFAKAVGTAGWVIDAVTPDQLALPTPCAEHDVRSLLGHVVDVMARIRLMGEGGDPMANGRVDVTAVPDDGWFELFRTRADQVQVAWTDPASLDRTVVLPWVTASGAAMLATYTSELTVHTWDLATATGHHPQWDDEVVAVAFAASCRTIPAEGRRAAFEAVIATMPPEVRPAGPPYGDVVDVAPDAAPIEQLVAWTGRRP